MPAKASTPPLAPAAQPPVAGTTPDSVTAALLVPSLRSLAGRAVLAFAGTPSWNGNPIKWRIRTVFVAAWAVLRARWLALRSFDLHLALAPWCGHPDRTATVVVDGFWLTYANGRLFLQIACPAGHDPHEVLLPSPIVLGELLVALQVAPDLPPWACPPGCPGSDLVALAAAGHPRLRPVPTNSTSTPPAPEAGSRVSSRPDASPAGRGGVVEEPPSC